MAVGSIPTLSIVGNLNRLKLKLDILHKFISAQIYDKMELKQ